MYFLLLSCREKSLNTKKPKAMLTSRVSSYAVTLPSKTRLWISQQGIKNVKADSLSEMTL